MKSVVIIGAGGSGREVLQIFQDINKVSETWNILGFIDENPVLHGEILNGYPVLGSLDWIEKNVSQQLHCIISINSPGLRKQVVERLKDIEITYCNAIHPTAIIWDSVNIGVDVVVQARALLSVDTVIENHVQLNTNTTIGHDAKISDYCTLGPRVDVNGNDVLHKGVYIGSGATLLQNVTIGKWTVIGAGAVVTRDIPAGKVAVGVPANPIKDSVLQD